MRIFLFFRIIVCYLAKEDFTPQAVCHKKQMFYITILSY